MFEGETVVDLELSWKEACALKTFLDFFCGEPECEAEKLCKDIGAALGKVGVTRYSNKILAVRSPTIHMQNKDSAYMSGRWF